LLREAIFENLGAVSLFVETAKLSIEVAALKAGGGQ
jgi:hypothetical protein